MKHFSASQITTYKDCPRKWWWGYVKNIKSPPTRSQELGSKVHKAIEQYIKTGQINKIFEDYIKVVIPYLDLTNKFLSEHRFELPLYGSYWLGFIDFYKESEIDKIIDFKTTSDFRYAKSSEDLIEDIQLNSYAKWALINKDANYVDVGLLYLLTSKRKSRVKSLYVEKRLEKDHINKIWKQCEDLTREMLLLYKVEDPKEVDCKHTSCGMYGGCFYSKNCLEVSDNFFKSFCREDEDKMGFLDQIGKNSATTTAKEEVEIVPPDSAPNVDNETLASEDEDKNVKNKTNNKKKSTKKAKLDFVLCIDCYGVKDSKKGIWFEEWFHPLLVKITSEAPGEAGEENGDFRLLPFQKSKMLLEESIEQYLLENGPPKLMYVSTTNWYARDALQVLTRYATEIYRALK